MRQFGLRPGKIKIEPLKYQLSMKICRNGNTDDCKLMKYVENKLSYKQRRRTNIKSSSTV